MNRARIMNAVTGEWEEMVSASAYDQARAEASAAKTLINAIYSMEPDSDEEERALTAWREALKNSRERTKPDET